MDELDLVQIDGVTCCHGHVLPFGATIMSNGGINFSVNSADAEGCELQLYHKGVNWADLDRHSDVFEFCRKMIRLRWEHPVLRSRTFFTGVNASGYPELSFHGEQAWHLNMWAPFLTFGFMYAEPDADFTTGQDFFIYCGVNAHWETHILELPQLLEGMVWQVYADSTEAEERRNLCDDGQIRLLPRSLMVLTAARDTGKQ